MDRHEENDKVELAKALLAVQSVASPSVAAAVRDLLVPAEHVAAVGDAVKGLSKEDDFSLMCRLMGTASRLAALEQRRDEDCDYLIPDFLAHFVCEHPPGEVQRSACEGLRCFVEVKSTSEGQFRIGGQPLQRLRRFADSFGLPLVFAVRFTGFKKYAFWVLAEDQSAKNSLKIKCTDIASGIRAVLWDDYFLMLDPGLAIREFYGTDRVLQKFQLVWKASGEVAAAFDDVDGRTLSAFCEAFDPHNVRSYDDNGRTVIERQPGPGATVADLIYRFNCLPRDEAGNPLFSPSRVLSGADRTVPLVTRAMVKHIVRSIPHGLIGRLSMEKDDLQVEKWKRLMRPRLSSEAVDGVHD